MNPRKAAGAEPLGEFFGAGVGGQFDRKGNDQSRVVGFDGAADEGAVNRLGRIVLYGLGRDFVKQVAGAGEQQFQMVVELRHGAHGGAARSHRVGLVNRNRRGNAFHLVNRRLVHAV